MASDHFLWTQKFPGEHVPDSSNLGCGLPAYLFTLESPVHVLSGYLWKSFHLSYKPIVTGGYYFLSLAYGWSMIAKGHCMLIIWKVNANHEEDACKITRECTCWEDLPCFWEWNPISGLYPTQPRPITLNVDVGSTGMYQTLPSCTDIRKSVREKDGWPCAKWAAWHKSTMHCQSSGWHNPHPLNREYLTIAMHKLVTSHA